MSLNLKISLAVIASVILASAAVKADERYRTVKNQTVIKECGACHMVFQPQMLPGKSWNKIMNTLPDHFGEDASLDAGTAASIKKYHMDNAADSGWRAGKFMRGLSSSSAPMRISETPYFIREHNEEVPDKAWKDPKVKSKANCLACHKEADRGYYDDD